MLVRGNGKLEPSDKPVLRNGITMGRERDAGSLHSVLAKKLNDTTN